MVRIKAAQIKAARIESARIRGARIKEIVRQLREQPASGKTVILKSLPIIKIAASIAWAETLKNSVTALQIEKEKAVQAKHDAKDRFRREIKKIESITGIRFLDLPPDIRMSSFLNKDIDGNRNVREYASEHFNAKAATEKLNRIGRSPTKPAERALNVFCRDMQKLFSEKGLKPNYELIAYIAKKFHLSKKDPTPASIRKRFSRDNIS
jgi:hypothetical protein